MRSSVICISGESNCIPFKRELSQYLLRYGAWEGTVIQFRNSKQRLEATPLTEPHDMLCFLLCNSLEYQQLGRDRTLMDLWSSWLVFYTKYCVIRLH